MVTFALHVPLLSVSPASALEPAPIVLASRTQRVGLAMPSRQRPPREPYPESTSDRLEPLRVRVDILSLLPSRGNAPELPRGKNRIGPSVKPA